MPKRIYPGKIAAPIKELSPKRIANRFTLRAVFSQFAERVGLVYFGFVDQRDDEHRLIRGMTVSRTHKDSHYCIGSYDGYDVMLVHRTDTLQVTPDHVPEPVAWVIMSVDLQRKADIPHVYIGHNKRQDKLLTKHSSMTELPLGAFGEHNQQFTKQYTMFGNLTDAVGIERAFYPALTQAILTYFDDYNIEVLDNVLYVSKASTYPSRQTLEKLLQSSVWLAKLLDGKQ